MITSMPVLFLPPWEDLNARARGLTGRLLGRDRLQALAGAPDLAELALALQRSGFLLPAAEVGYTAPGLELAVRRVAAQRLRLLARWAGERTRRLAVVFQDEDRRSIRAIVRGAFTGTAPELRLSGLIPTPELPERALQELATATTPGGVSALLTLWGNPYGAALREAAAASRPDLFQLEMALSRTFVAQALEGARRAGRALQQYVREGIDLENLRAALVLVRDGSGENAEESFLEGGERLEKKVYLQAAGANEMAAAASMLASALSGTLYAEALREHAQDARTLEEALLGAQLRERMQAARRDPLGPAPLLAYVLQLRAESVDLRRIIWGIALGAPRAPLRESLVSAR